MNPAVQPSGIGGLARRLAGSTAGFIPLPVLRRGLGGGGPLILCLHLLSNEQVPHVTPLYNFRSLAQFEQDIEFLLRSFIPVNLGEVLGWLSGKHELPSNSLFLTFDDGLREVAEIVAPLLKRKGVPAAFFINSRFLDNRALFYRFKAALLISSLRRQGRPGMTQKISECLRRRDLPADDAEAGIRAIRFSDDAVLNELAGILEVDFDRYLREAKPFLASDEVERLLRDGFDIGAHSLDHRPYAGLELEEQLRQTRDDLAQLVDRFSLRHRSFAFPFNAEGVGPEFYDALIREGSVEAFFGLGGRHHDPSRRLLNRLSFEGDQPPAKEFISRSLARAWVSRLGL